MWIQRLYFFYPFREKHWLLILQSKKKNAAQLDCWIYFIWTVKPQTICGFISLSCFQYNVHSRNVHIFPTVPCVSQPLTSGVCGHLRRFSPDKLVCCLRWMYEVWTQRSRVLNCSAVKLLLCSPPVWLLRVRGDLCCFTDSCQQSERLLNVSYPNIVHSKKNVMSLLKKV